MFAFQTLGVMNEAADEIATGAQVKLSNVFSIHLVSFSMCFDLYAPYENCLVNIIYLSTVIAVNALVYAWCIQTVLMRCFHCFASM